jgi:hypothetical protein
MQRVHRIEASTSYSHSTVCVRDTHRITGAAFGTLGEHIPLQRFQIVGDQGCDARLRRDIVAVARVVQMTAHPEHQEASLT